MHVFTQELKIYVAYLRKEIEQLALEIKSEDRREKYLEEFKANLIQGVEYYRELALQLLTDQRQRFLDDLDSLHDQLVGLLPRAHCDQQSC